MGILIDITGKKFGRWSVIRIDSKSTRPKKFICKCDCGNFKSVSGKYLRDGISKSCGCLMRELISKRNFKHGHARNRSKSVTAIYRTWASMIQRCCSKEADQYHNYGGRGITVCERWLVFKNFLADMGERPNGKTIDRKDVNGNYCRDNCRWATSKEQGRNKRNTIKIELNGVVKSIEEWAEGAAGNITGSLIRQRIGYGWSFYDALTIPVGERRAKR